MRPLLSWVARDNKGTGLLTTFHGIQRDLLVFRDGAFAAIFVVRDLDVVLPRCSGADVFWCNLVLEGISSPFSTFSIA
jgi:hypothetical protein